MESNALTKEQLALLGIEVKSDFPTVPIRDWDVGEEEEEKEIPNPWDAPAEPPRAKSSNLISPTLWGGVAYLGTTKVPRREVSKVEQLVSRNRIFTTRIIVGTKCHQWQNAPTTHIFTWRRLLPQREVSKIQEEVPTPLQPKARQVETKWTFWDKLKQLREYQQWLIIPLLLGSSVVLLNYLLPLPRGH